MDSKSPNYELETEDALSLCDLSIYTDSTSDTEQGSLNSSFAFADEDFFEFFTDKQHIPCFQPPETILFCGKIITRPNQGLVWRNSVNSDLNVCKRKKDVLSMRTWSRWQLFVFGLAKLPKEVYVEDSPRSSERRNPKECKRRRKGLWGVVRDFSCGRHSLQHP